MQKKSRIKRPEYTFDELKKHIQVFFDDDVPKPPHFLQFEHPVSFDQRSLQVARYFAIEYPDSDEYLTKGVIFQMILFHISKYRETYDSEKFAVYSDQTFSMISNGLLKACLFYFQNWINLPASEDEMPKLIKEKARQYMKEEDANQKPEGM